MKKITNRAVSVLLLAVLIILGMLLYVIRYADEGEDWAMAYSRANAGSSGAILDRNGLVLASFNATENAFSPDEATRIANYHITGDYWGRSSTGLLTRYDAMLKGYSPLTGVTVPKDTVLRLNVDAELNNKAYAETFRAPNAHILVVDDTKMNLTVVEGLLKRSQIHVDTALSGMEALELVQHKRYDVIFIDHRMPQMDGVETFHAMQKLPNNRSAGAPCIMFTANAVSGAREAFLAEGFSNYLTKPVDSLELEKMLVRYLPKELVIIVRGDGSAEEEKKQHDLEEFQGIEGMDAALALQNCGSPETLREALREYRDNIEQKANLLEQYLSDGACEEYTVLVHSIKSSSRLIGAADLARQAAYLEQCGDEKKMDELAARTPELLSLYRSYIDKLALFADRQSAQKPLIGDKQFQSAMDAIREYASAFDFNSADKIIEMLDKYTIPEKEQKKYADVKRKVRAGDSGALVHMLEM